MVTDEFITKLKWQAATKELTDITTIWLDCFVFLFAKPLTYEEQNDFMSFISDADKLNSMKIGDFCIYFINQDIKFDLVFKYCFYLNPIVNFKRYIYFKILKKIIDKHNKENY